LALQLAQAILEPRRGAAYGLVLGVQLIDYKPVGHRIGDFRGTDMTGQRILAARHQLSARVSAFALDHDALTGRRGDVRHQAHVDSFLLEIRALLNVQFNKLMKAAARFSDRI